MVEEGWFDSTIPSHHARVLIRRVEMQKPSVPECAVPSELAVLQRTQAQLRDLDSEAAKMKGKAIRLTDWGLGGRPRGSPWGMDEEGPRM